MSIRRIMNYSTAETNKECFTLFDFHQPHNLIRSKYTYLSGSSISDVAMEHPAINDCAAWFNGGGALVWLPDGEHVSDGDYTIEFWIYVYRQEAKWQRVFIQGINACATFNVVIVQYFDDIVLLDCAGLSTASFRVAITGLYQSEWHHIAFTRDASLSRYKGYLDGQDVGTTNHPVSSASTTGYSYFGCYDSYRNFAECGLSEFRIWQEVREQVDIQANMNKALVGTETNLYRYWKLNDRSSTVVDTVNASNGSTWNGVVWLPT